MEKSDAEKKLAKIEEQNRARVKRFMEKAKEQGKKQISAFLSGEAYDTLCRIRDNATQAGAPVSFGQIIERALAVYVKTSVNINDDINQPEKASEQEPGESPALVEPVKPIKETQIEIPGPEPEVSTEKKPFDKDEICKIIVDLRDNKKMAYEAIAAKLKEKGYSPKTEGKDSFHHSTISNYYKDAKKKTKKN